MSDAADRVSLEMTAADGVRIKVDGVASSEWPAESVFPSLSVASEFFRAGCNGYSVTQDSGRLDGLCLDIHDWRTEALSVTQAASTLYDDPKLFPPGSIQLDHALLMRNAEHSWRALDDVEVAPAEIEFRVAAHS